MRKPTRFFFLSFLLTLAACSANLSPVDIEDGDICSFCKMAISERQYAAEIITEEEAVLKFDDIGCMLKFQKKNSENSQKAAVIYVADSRTKAWLKADDAFFARSGSVKTPMGSGIVAFSTAESAGPDALRFSQLVEK